SKFRCKHYSGILMKELELELESGDAIILNLIEIHDITALKELQRIVDFIGQNGGILLVISAPKKYIKSGSNYHFLPWASVFLGEISTYDAVTVHATPKTPSWVDDFIRIYQKKIIAPVSFSRLPTNSHELMAYHKCVSFNYKYKKGRILLVPSIQSIMVKQTVLQENQLNVS
ncbi:MAG: hypothetical protein ACTSUB_08890, partial [Candidatus Thorarchaeota archaeon]